MKINKLWNWLFNPPLDGPSGIILLRLMAGGVFLWEGMLKFIYVNQGVLEIVGGILLITGFLTRAIAIPFVIEMLVAILSTKISLYLGTSPLPLPPVPPQIGLWAVLHEVRSEYAQLMTTFFLLLAGPGGWSLDALLVRKRKEGKHTVRNEDRILYLGYSE